MKKLIFIMVVFLSSVCYGQGVRLKTPLAGFSSAEFIPITGYTKINARYEWVAGAFDSGLHVPQYNGVPTDRSGVWMADGAVAVDSSAGYFYWRNGGVWIKAAKYSDLASVTVPISSLTAATGTNSINVSDAQTWTANSLTTASQFTHSTTSLTTGNLINLLSTSTALASGNEALNIGVSGANGTNAITATGARISVTNTNATSGTNVGLEVSASGATTGNYAIVVPSSGGSVGIGTSSPTASSLHIVSPVTTGSDVSSGIVGDFNSLTSGNGMYLSTNSITSGAILKLESTSTASNIASGLDIAMSGINANSNRTTVGLFSGVTNSGTGSINVAAEFTAQAGGNNYAIIVGVNSGDVGIGTSTPTSKLHVVPTQTTGIGVAVASSTTTSGSIVDITGTSTALAANNEGLNIAISGANGTNAITATGARISVTNTNATSGTNIGLDVTATGATTANYALKLVDGSQGSGKVLTSDANGNASWATPSGGGLTVGTTAIASGTAGALLIEGAGNVLQEDAAQLFWDNTNNRLGIGTNAPTTDLEVYNASGGALILSQSGSYGSIQKNNGTDGIWIRPTSSSLPVAYIQKESIIGTGDLLWGGYTASSSANIVIDAYNSGDLYLQTRNPASSGSVIIRSGDANEKTRFNTVGQLMSSRMMQKQGADVASAAGAITLGSDGNTFEITGTAAITLISNVNWQNGSVVHLVFTSTATLTDGTANSGTNIGMELAGGANFTGSADDIVTLVLSEMGGTQRWREVSRSVN